MAYKHPYPLCLSDFEHNKERFDLERGKIKVLCIGDSITGWNNTGPVGMLSDCGPDLVTNCLEMFSSAKYFVIGFGTNDLAGQEGMGIGTVSEKLIENMDKITKIVRARDGNAIIMNVPPVNYSKYNRSVADEIRRKREYHNPRLADLCRKNNIQLVDIYSKLADDNFADGLHPNESGAKIIAGAVLQHLTRW
jgi:lysophospholipase L1-like esterase